MKPYLRNTSHKCSGTVEKEVRIEYNDATQSWDVTDSNLNFVNAMVGINWCPYCGAALKTCTKKEAIADFFRIMFG